MKSQETTSTITTELVASSTTHTKGAGPPLHTIHSMAFVRRTSVMLTKSGRIAAATHPDTEILTNARWTEWNIPATEFTTASVSMTAVRKMYIGTGSHAAAVPGGTGVVFIDDVRIDKRAVKP